MEFYFRQHYFTSSKKKGGFFTLDQSPDLSQDEIRELESKGLYSPPPLLDPSAGQLDIEKYFPENFSFYKLKNSGTWVLAHSNYTGVSNHSTHRYGNFFTHSLIMRDQPGIPIKLLFDAAHHLFKRRLTLEEDASYQPSLARELCITIDDIPAKLVQAFNELCHFLNAEVGRLNFFLKLLDLMIAGKISKKGYNITLCDQKDHLEQWVMAINYFLPRKLANQLGFASYVDNPDNNSYSFEVTGIIPDCGIQELPDPYFTLLQAKSGKEYAAQNLYTRLLMSIIANIDYSGWRRMRNTLDSYDFHKLDSSLNTPLRLVEFQQNIASASDQQWYAIYRDLTINKQKELRHFTAEQNLPLYCRLIEEESAQIAKDPRSNAKRKWEDFQAKLAAERLLVESDTLAQLIWAFWNAAPENERNIMAMWALLAEPSTNRPYFNIFLEAADAYFRDYRQERSKKQVLYEFVEAYPVNILRENQLPNIRTALTLEAEEERLERATIVELSANYIDDFKGLDRAAKKQKLLTMLNKGFKKPFNGDFLPYLGFVSKVLENDNGDFWQIFFEKNEKYSEEDCLRHSLSYLKKKFVVDIYTRHEPEISIARSLSFDKVEAYWVANEIREYSTRQGSTNAFINDHNRRCGYWDKIG